MRLHHLLPVALLALTVSSAGAVVTPIGDLHCNKVNGIPAAIGQQVTVQGTVTLPHGLLSPTNIDCHIQDATGGMDVFIGGGVGTYTFNLGDSVEVTGYIRHFNGLAEIDSTGFITVTQLGPATFQPEPQVMTCLQVRNSFLSSHCEPDESRLIRVNNVHITSGAWPTTHLGVNTTLTIEDVTGTTTVFIDLDTPVNGSPSPGSKFDLIGVLRQFDSSNPYTTGYQLVPRFVSDVIPACPGPGFQSIPEVTSVDSLSATITWNTDVSGTSFIDYGPTTAYGTRVGSAAPTTSHSVTLTSLQPRTLYHFRAESGDGNGTCHAEDQGLVTFPSPGTPGEISVYFNQTVNTAYSKGHPYAAGNYDFLGPMLPIIDAATTSIDCAFYSFNLSQVADRLIAAHDRGVEIRLIIDEGAATTQADRLAAEGIPYIDSRFGGLNHSQSAGFGIMHNKYMLVDGRSPDKDDATLWTGSWNVTSQSQNEANNVIVFHDYGLVAAYTLDFEQMWGSSTLTPNPAESRMGSRKREIMPHLFRVGDRPVEAYQSPSDKTETHMIAYLQQAQYSQQFAVFDFTSDPLSHAMKVHRDSIPGFVVQGNLEGSQISSSSEYCKIDGQIACPDYWDPRGDITQNTSGAFTLLHHKYQILDEGHPGALVWTGSHNWSAAAKTTNDENTVVVHDPEIVNFYLQEFAARFLESGGSIPLTGVPPRAGTAGIELQASRPNPARESAWIGYALSTDAPRVSLSIFDLGGRRVRTLVDGPKAAGPHQALWDGRNQSGRPEPAGLYFYRLDVGPHSVTRRLALTR